MSFGPKVSPTIPDKIHSPTSGFQQTSLTKMFQDGPPEFAFTEAGSRGRLRLSEVERYRQYAKGCVRIASTMSGADRRTLLKIAEAWEGRAREAEENSKRSAPMARIRHSRNDNEKLAFIWRNDRRYLTRNCRCHPHSNIANWRQNFRRRRGMKMTAP